MKTSRFLVPTLALCALGAAFLAWRQQAELVEIRAVAAANAQWQRKAGELEKLNLEQRAQLTAAQALAERNTAAAAPTARPVPAARAGEPGPREAGNVVPQQTAAIRQLMETAEVQAMLGVQKKAAIEQRYRDLFRTMNLPPEKIEKLKALLEERSNVLQDVFAAAREQGINLRGNPDAYKKLVTDSQTHLNDSIKAAIGDAGFAQLTNFERSGPQRSVVSELEERLSYTHAPLNQGQAEQLIKILAANPPQRPTPTAAGRTSPGAAVDSGALVRTAMTTVPGVGLLLGSADDSGRTPAPAYPITTAALSQAQAVLTPPQLAALNQLHQQQQAQARLKQLVTETLLAIPPPAGGNSTPPRAPGGR